MSGNTGAEVPTSASPAKRKTADGRGTQRKKRRLDVPDSLLASTGPTYSTGLVTADAADTIAAENIPRITQIDIPEHAQSTTLKSWLASIKLGHVKVKQKVAYTLRHQSGIEQEKRTLSDTGTFSRIKRLTILCISEMHR